VKQLQLRVLDQVYNAMGVQRNNWGKFYEKTQLLNKNGHIHFVEQIESMLADEK
jgi:hypothetical protein